MTNTRKTLLYGGAIALLIGLNAWRYLASPDDAPTVTRTTSQQAITLPDLAFDTSPPTETVTDHRDIFRTIAPIPEPEQTNAIAISIGHSNSAYSLELV